MTPRGPNEEAALAAALLSGSPEALQERAALLADLLGSTPLARIPQKGEDPDEPRLEHSAPPAAAGLDDRIKEVVSGLPNRAAKATGYRVLPTLDDTGVLNLPETEGEL